MPVLTNASPRSPLLGYGLAAAGLAGGLVAFAALPFAAVLYMLPLGAVVGAGIGVALPARDEQSAAVKKPLQQKVVDGFLGAFVGAIGATLIPASPLAALGASIGYSVGTATTRLRQSIRPHITIKASAPVIVPDTSAAASPTTLKSGLGASFAAGQNAQAPTQDSAPAAPRPPASPR